MTNWTAESSGHFVDTPQAVCCFFFCCCFIFKTDLCKGLCMDMAHSISASSPSHFRYHACFTFRGNIWAGLYLTMSPSLFTPFACKPFSRFIYYQCFIITFMFYKQKWAKCKRAMNLNYDNLWQYLVAPFMAKWERPGKNKELIYRLTHCHVELN